MKNLKLTLPLITVAALVVLFGFNAKAELSEAEAREYLKRGAWSWTCAPSRNSNSRA